MGPRSLGPQRLLGLEPILHVVDHELLGIRLATAPQCAIRSQVLMDPRHFLTRIIQVRYPLASRAPRMAVRRGIAMAVTHIGRGSEFPLLEPLPEAATVE